MKKKIILIVSSVILLLLVFWLGFSFFSMNSNSPYVGISIDLGENTIAQKARGDYPQRDGKYVKYSFPIVLEQYNERGDEYVISGIPSGYQNYYDTRDEARFDYSLKKDKGKFNFQEVEWNDSLFITLRYKLDKNFKYFSQFSLCTIQKLSSGILNLDNDVRKGKCIVNRDLYSWEIVVIDKSTAEQISFFDSYDRNTLVRRLINFYISDDFGYFHEGEYKTLSSQISRENGTYMFGSDIVNSKETSDDLSMIWVLAAVSDIYKNSSDEYPEIDFESYMYSLLPYSKNESYKSLLSCEMSYKIISNLYSCKSENCEKIKEKAFSHCTNIVVKKTSDISSKNYDIDLVIDLPSDLVFYNRIIKLIAPTQTKYNEKEIMNYYNLIKQTSEENPTVVNKCYTLKNINEINSEYPKAEYRNIQSTSYGLLPKFDTFCSDFVKDEYCTSNIPEQLVCIDAISSIDKEYAKRMLAQIFYNYFFESPASNKMIPLEDFRVAPPAEKSEKGIKLYEYGYFVYRKETKTDEEVNVWSTARIFDSYYFIYVLSKISNE